MIKTFFFLQIFNSLGVLWAGSKLISNSVETINFLKENGKQVFYVTNNSTKTRSQYLVRLLEIGYNAEEVFYVQLRVPVHINFNIDLFISEKLLHQDS